VLTQYLYGIEYAPVDVRLALVDSSQGKLGTLTDTALLYCFHYDPSTGKYSASIMNIVRAAGALTVLGLGLFMFIAFRREKKEGAAAGR
jgi:protein SCO1/2